MFFCTVSMNIISIIIIMSVVLIECWMFVTVLEQTKVPTRTKHTIWTHFTCVLCIFFRMSIIYLFLLHLSVFILPILFHYQCLYCDIFAAFCNVLLWLCTLYTDLYFIYNCYRFITLFNSVVFLACVYQSVLQIMSHFYFVDYSWQH